MRKLLLIAFLVLSATGLAQKKEEIAIRISIDGTTTVPQPVKRAIIAALPKTITEPQQIEEELGERIRDGFQQYGYFTADVYVPDPLPKSPSDRHQPMAVTFIVHEGPMYRLGVIHFKGQKAFTEERLRKLFPMNESDIFDVEKIRTGMKALRDLYGQYGYINFTPVPNTDTDTDRRIINVIFDLDEGQQYRFGKLFFRGLEPRAGAAKEISEAWKESFEGKIFTSRRWEQILLIGYSGRSPKTHLERLLRPIILNGGRFESAPLSYDGASDTILIFP